MYEPETKQQKYTRLWNKRTQLKLQIRQLEEEYEQVNRELAAIVEQIYLKL